MGEISYRALEPGEDEFIEYAEDIYERSWGRTEYMPDEEQISEWVDREYFDVFMAFEAEDPVGSAVISYGEVGEFLYDGVKPGCQGEGVGEGLFKARRKAAETYGCEKLFTAATANHTGSQKIYERNGFEPTGILIETGKNGFEEDHDTVVLMTNFLEDGRPKTINVPDNYRFFVENRLEEFSNIGERSYNKLGHRDKKAYKTKSENKFIVDFINDGLDVFGKTEDLESVLQEIGEHSADSKLVNVDLSDGKSAEAIKSLESRGFRPCGYFPHWIGGKKDYFLVQDVPRDSTEAVLTDNSLQIAEELGLVQDKEKKDGDWAAILG